VVDAYDSNPVPVLYTGASWSFITTVGTPVISAVLPDYTLVAPGADTVLSVTTTNADTLQWMKDGSLIFDGIDYVGVTTDTLTILGAAVTDEGVYTCTATNAAGTDTSDPGGTVYLEQLVMHYPMDVINIVDGNSVTPDIESGYDLTLQNAGTGSTLPTLITDDPNVVVGTGALLFAGTGDPNIPQAYTNAIAEQDIFRLGCSVEFWSKATTVTTNTMFQAVDASGNRLMSAHLPHGGTIYWDTSWDVQTERISRSVDFDLVQQWNHYAFTKSVDSGQLRIYVNGQIWLIGSGTLAPISDVAELHLNKTLPGVDGVLDDVKFYNYARSTSDIAQDYLAGSGDDSICDLEGAADLTFDSNDDCVVDLSDFAAFAATWLNSTLIYPAP
jgi:hypothetical protein